MMIGITTCHFSPFGVLLDFNEGHPLRWVVYRASGIDVRTPLATGMLLTQERIRLLSISAHYVNRSVMVGSSPIEDIQIRPWSCVEEIAAYVAGDGTDPQRLALADGIRQGYGS